MVRALVLDTGKRLCDEALAQFAGEVDLLRLSTSTTGPLSVPAFEPERQTVRIVDGLVARSPFQHVVASSESNLAFAGFLHSRYGLPGMSYDQALVATNKWRMKQRLAEALPSAACWLSGDFLAGPHRPSEVVVKPLSGSSCKGVRRLPTDQALQELADHDELLLVEEAVDIECELHCDGVVRGGELLVALPSAYDRPVLGAVGTTHASIHLPAHDDRHEAAVQAAHHVVETLRIGTQGIADFVFHLELFQVHGELLFGEIGLRPAGAGIAESLRHFHGVDIWAEFVGLQLGRPPRVGSQTRRDSRTYRGVTAITPDVRLSAQDLLAVPGISHVSPGSPKAHREAEAGSSCAFTHLAFFEFVTELQARQTIAHLNRVGTR
ncbi:MAG: Formate-dependent phosphoribosylglycinamide formyltransferase [Pseudonocardia sp.]|nr:Formate-dependent phosphoribosylglycinamide formyltransferase [Pseudonocardia sp.]